MTRPARLLALLLLTLATLSLAGAGRPLAPPLAGPTAEFPFNPVTAYAGGRFLTIWQEGMGLAGSRVMGALSDASGAKISPRAFPIDIPPAVFYRLAATGDSFTLFWLDAERRAFMADVDLEGRVTNPRPVALPDHGDAAFAWNGMHFAGVLRKPFSNVAYAVVFDRDGRIVLPPSVIPGRTNAFDVVAAGERFVVLNSFNSILAHELTPAGVGPQLLIGNADGASIVGARPHPVVGTPAGNGDVMVVWGTSRDGLGQLEATLVRPDGTHSEESLLFISSTEIIPIEVLRAGDGYVAAFRNGNALYRIRFDAAGVRTGEPELVQTGLSEALSAAASPSVILVALQDAAFQVGTVAIPAQGSPRPFEHLSIGNAIQSQPVLGPAAGAVFAAWTESTTEGAVVRGTTVDADGAPGEPVRIATGTLLSNETAFNGAHHLIVHADATRLMATRVTAGGTVSDAAPIVLANVSRVERPQAAVVWAGSRWIVVWTDSARLYAIVISATGQVLSTRTLEVHVPLRDAELRRFVSLPTLAFDGTRVLLAWSEGQGVDCWFECVNDPAKVYAIRLTRTAIPADDEPVEAGVTSPQSLSAASSGSEFLVVADNEARVLDGTRLRVTAARELFDWPVLSDVTWDGATYVVALRYAAVSSYLAVLRLDRAANDAAVRRGGGTLAPSVLTPPSVAAPFAGSALAGVQEGSLDGLLATLYREHDLPPLPAPPGPPRNVRVLQVTRVVWEVSWDAPDGGADAYVVDVEGPYAFDSITAERSVRVVSETAPAVTIRAFNAGGLSAPSGLEPGPAKRRSVR